MMSDGSTQRVAEQRLAPPRRAERHGPSRLAAGAPGRRRRSGARSAPVVGRVRRADVVPRSPAAGVVASPWRTITICPSASRQTTCRSWPSDSTTVTVAGEHAVRRAQVLGPHADDDVDGARGAHADHRAGERSGAGRDRSRRRRRPPDGVHRRGADEARRRTGSRAGRTPSCGGPTCWSTPSLMIAMRCPIVIASTWSWVT